MNHLWSLLIPATRMRCYALLDSRGICRALRQSRSIPKQNGWVEVESVQLNWIGQPLPLQAILPPAPRTTRRTSALAA